MVRWWESWRVCGRDIEGGIERGLQKRAIRRMIGKGYKKNDRKELCPILKVSLIDTQLFLSSIKKARSTLQRVVSRRDLRSHLARRGRLDRGIEWEVERGGIEKSYKQNHREKLYLILKALNLFALSYF